jgi:cell division protein FtsW
VTDRVWETRLLAMVVAGLVVVGLAAVYGASSLVATPSGLVGNSYALRQAVGAVLGGILAMVFARIDYTRWRQWAWPLIVVTAVLLLIPLLPFTHSIAPPINGARRWISFGPVQFQPSEVAKLAVVVWTAMLAAKKGELIRSFRRGPAPVLVVLVPVVLLIFLEPNLSMALLVGLLGGLVLFAAGARIGHFLLLGALAAPILYRAVADAQYRLARVLTFLNPGSAPTEANWQVKQSLIGIGAGGFLGAGYGQGQQQLGYLPYAYSDFVLSSIGEEWGFVGIAAVTTAFGVLLWLGFRIARSAPDPFGRLLATGITAMIGLSAILHIGVSLAVIPATGIPLPFISYGRSSLMVSLVAIGILISVGHARGKRSNET